MNETTAVLGPERNLIATFCPPAGAAPGRVGLLLTNSGVIPRAGPHRMNVHLARHFAPLGLPSVRFDMSGLGDSRRASGRLGTLEQWVGDTQAVMDAAQSRLGIGEFVMVGFCSGAEVAHVTALRDKRLRGVVLWDSFSYPTLQTRLRALWHRLQRRGWAGAAGGVARGLVRGAGRLLPTKADTPAHEQGRMWQGEPDTVPSLDEYAGRLRTLVDQGVKLLVVHSGGEPLSYNHHGQFARTVGRQGLFARLDFTYLDKADHLLTRDVSQQAFIHTVADWLRKGQFLGAPADRALHPNKTTA